METIITEWHVEEALAAIRTQTALIPALNFQLLLQDLLCFVGNKQPTVSQLALICFHQFDKNCCLVLARCFRV